MDPSGHICQDKYNAVEEIKKREGCTSKEALEKYNEIKKKNPKLSPEQVKNKYLADNTSTTKSRLPKNNGRWEGTPGNGIWYSDNPLVQAGFKTNKEAREFLASVGWPPHHLSNKVIILVPTDLHGNVPHIGSASDMRNN